MGTGASKKVKKKKEIQPSVTTSLELPPNFEHLQPLQKCPSLTSEESLPVSIIPTESDISESGKAKINDFIDQTNCGQNEDIMVHSGDVKTEAVLRHKKTNQDHMLHASTGGTRICQVSKPVTISLKRPKQIITNNKSEQRSKSFTDATFLRNASTESGSDLLEKLRKEGIVPKAANINGLSPNTREILSQWGEISSQVNKGGQQETDGQETVTMDFKLPIPYRLEPVKHQNLKQKRDLPRRNVLIKKTKETLQVKGNEKHVELIHESKNKERLLLDVELL